MSAPTPNTATGRAAARLLAYYDSHPDVLDRTVDSIVKHFEFEHHLNDVHRMFGIRAAKLRHPSMTAKNVVCGGESPEWQPDPDPIHWQPRMSNWDIVRDLLALAWKAVRR